MYILVLNAGSSSLKFQLFQRQAKQLLPHSKGLADAINLPNSLIQIDKFAEKTPIKNHQEALQKIFQLLLEQKVLENLNQISLIGHRVVHGGEKYHQATIINNKVIKDIHELCRLAPLHNPHNLAGILSCQKLLPKVKQVAVFDTAFHQTMPAVAYLYALPLEIYKKYHIRRYGFHGINHKYVSQQAIKALKSARKPHSKIISCHLGNGCSVTAIKNGQSIDTSMGFTPLEGLVMGTRSGDLDPTIPAELAKIMHLSPLDLNNFLNKKSGLLGLTKLSSDMRTIYQAAQKGNPKALFAMDLLSYHLAKYINSYIGILNGVNAIIFTGGIGEDAWYIRERVCKYLQHLNIKLGKVANQNDQTFINSTDSSAKIMIIPANEELEIAQQALAIF